MTLPSDPLSTLADAVGRYVTTQDTIKAAAQDITAAQPQLPPASPTTETEPAHGISSQS